MMMPNRSYSATTGYRYGFNGKENDNEVKGEGNEQDYGARIYDTRLGRFLSVDPISKSYPELTPYQFASNSPIANVDIDGLERGSAISAGVSSGANRYSNEKSEQGKGLLRFVTSFEPYKAGWNYIKDIGKSATGDKAAIQRVSDKTTKASTNFAYSVANSVSEPAVFFSTMHTRSLQKNTEGIMYYGLKYSEFAVLFETAEAFRTETAQDVPYYIAKNKPEVHVDLMGGPVSKLGNEWINFDEAATAGIKDDVANFGRWFGKNTVSEIVANNPRAEFIQHVTESLEEGGTITIRGTTTNKYFNKIWDGKAEGLDKYDIIKKTENVENKGYMQSGGKKAVSGQINEIILRKKKG